MGRDLRAARQRRRDLIVDPDLLARRVADRDRQVLDRPGRQAVHGRRVAREGELAIVFRNRELKAEIAAPAVRPAEFPAQVLASEALMPPDHAELIRGALRQLSEAGLRSHLAPDRQHVRHDRGRAPRQRAGTPGYLKPEDHLTGGRVVAQVRRHSGRRQARPGRPGPTGQGPQGRRLCLPQIGRSGFGAVWLGGSGRGRTDRDAGGKPGQAGPVRVPAEPVLAVLAVLLRSAVLALGFQQQAQRAESRPARLLGRPTARCTARRLAGR